MGQVYNFLCRKRGQGCAKLKIIYFFSRLCTYTYFLFMLFHCLIMIPYIHFTLGSIITSGILNTDWMMRGVSILLYYMTLLHRVNDQCNRRKGDLYDVVIWLQLTEFISFSFNFAENTIGIKQDPTYPELGMYPTVKLNSIWSNRQLGKSERFE